MHSPLRKNSSVENAQGVSGVWYIKNMDLIYTALKLTQSLREVLAKFLTYLTGLYRQMMGLLRDSRQRMRLSLHCQLCGGRYSRSSDLSNHLQGSHSRLWRLSQQLTLVLVQLICSSGNCVCNPSLHVNRLGHICQQLRQLSMLYHMMEDKIFAPFQASEDSLARLLTKDLPRPFRFLLEQIVTYRCFEKLWQDPTCVQALHQRCIFCGQEHDASAMCQHLREAHTCSHLAFSFYMSTLAPMMLAQQTVDHQCNACNQIYNLPATGELSPDPARQQLAQSHLLHNCPNSCRWCCS